MVTETRQDDRPDGPTLLDIFRRALLIQLNDERLRAAIKAGRLQTPYYSPRGQEIIPSAISACLRPDDYVVTIYRGVHDQLAKGLPLRLLWAEYAGRVTGSCKGKGGPMHITHPETGIMVTTGIVGSGIPIANGLALSSLAKKDGRVTVSNFGDGASNIGAFHEGLNMASIWKLPVLFVCQNNLYGEHSAYALTTAVSHVADRAGSYSMPGFTVDGNDPVAMWRVARDAIERARNGDGPTLIEAVTFRFNGHNMGDDGHYIPAEEMEAARARDPMPRLKALLVDEGHATQAELDAIAVAIEAEIADAVEFALGSAFPVLEELRRDVYAEEIAA
jgi:pyruvate dehydrogenase E1 component alpha subunit